MDLNYIKKLVKLVDESGVDEIEIEEEGAKIRVTKSRHNSSPAPAYVPQYIPQPQYQYQPQPAPEPKAAAAAPTEPATPQKAEGKKYHEVRSPIVGTFYSAPAPNADPYVQVGGVVQQGTVLCIIEAMKLMNEIESDMAGRVVQVLAENGQPVEYNQPLFLIEPA